MRQRQRMIATALVGVVSLGLVSGCQSGAPPKRNAAVAASEPSLAMPGDPHSGLVASAPANRTPEFVQRHPLFSKPREMYDKSGNNTLVKAGAATFVGIPMGVYGELKQIVVGRPPATPGY